MAKKAKGTRGRPSKFSVTTVKKITDAIAAGDTIVDACVVAGISTSTLQHWRAQARAGDSKKLRFLEQLEYAQAQARRIRLKEIADGRMINGQKDWKATAMYLKMTDPMFSNAAITQRALDNAMGARLEAMEAHMDGDAIAQMWAAYAKSRGITIE